MAQVTSVSPMCETHLHFVTFKYWDTYAVGPCLALFTFRFLLKLLKYSPLLWLSVSNLMNIFHQFEFFWRHEGRIHHYRILWDESNKNFYMQVSLSSIFMAIIFCLGYLFILQVHNNSFCYILFWVASKVRK